MYSLTQNPFVAMYIQYITWNKIVYDIFWRQSDVSKII